MMYNELQVLTKEETKEINGGNIIDDLHVLSMLPFVLAVESGKAFFAGFRDGTR